MVDLDDMCSFSFWRIQEFKTFYSLIDFQLKWFNLPIRLNNNSLILYFFLVSAWNFDIFIYSGWWGQCWIQRNNIFLNIHKVMPCSFDWSCKWFWELTNLIACSCIFAFSMSDFYSCFAFLEVLKLMIRYFKHTKRVAQEEGLFGFWPLREDYFC